MENKEISAAYLAAKAAHESRTKPKSDFLKELIEQTEISQSSASSIIYHIFPKLLSGDLFTRRLANPYKDYFLKGISVDYPTKSRNANSAIRKNEKYLETIRLKKILENEQAKDSTQQEFVETKRREQRKSKAEVLNELKNLEDIEQTEEITFKGRRIKRFNKVIADIKYVRGSKCQLCDTYILKKDGGQYIEAAHIKAKKDRGGETLRNIILLCPNHHKEFDLGNRSEPIFTATHVSFILNKIKYKVRWC